MVPHKQWFRIDHKTKTKQLKCHILMILSLSKESKQKKMDVHLSHRESLDCIQVKQRN